MNIFCDKWFYFCFTLLDFSYAEFPCLCAILQICSLMRGGIAERGGVRVGHRIIEINGQSVVATAHEKIVQALSNSVGEVKLMHKHMEKKIIAFTCSSRIHLNYNINSAVTEPLKEKKILLNML